MTLNTTRSLPNQQNEASNHSLVVVIDEKEQAATKQQDDFKTTSKLTTLNNNIPSLRHYSLGDIYFQNNNLNRSNRSISDSFNQTHRFHATHFSPSISSTMLPSHQQVKHKLQIGKVSKRNQSQTLCM